MFFLPNVTTPTCFFSKFYKNEKSLQPSVHITRTILMTGDFKRRYYGRAVVTLTRTVNLTGGDTTSLFTNMEEMYLEQEQLT